MSFTRPVAGNITQDFDGAFSWEGHGYYRNGTIPRGKKSWFSGGEFRRHLHLGIDYACPTGTPVRAVHDGVIVAQGRYSYTGEYYLILRIKRSLRYQVVAYYTHLKAGTFRYRVGSKVSEGAVLALSGNTGWSTGPHLHFELRRGFRWESTSFANTYRWMRFDPQPFVRGDAALRQIV